MFLEKKAYRFFISFLIFTGCDAGVVKRAMSGKLTGGKEEALHNRDLGPPDHLDAVKYERDGDVNVEFHHEIFLGEEKHHFHERNNKKEQLAKLEEIFHKVDTDNDKYIQEPELHAWIVRMVNEHMKQANDESEAKFFFVAGSSSEPISFQQFQKAFVESLRLGNASHNGQFTQKYINGRLPVIKEKWEKADVNGDDLLSKKEFLFFQHPEMSKTSLKANVEGFMDERDHDANGKLDEKEFVFGFPVGDIKLDDYMDGDELIRDKINQFRKFIDVDKDGYLSVDELSVFLDPFSNLNARSDALDMMFYIDTDLDQKLSLDEVKEASEYLTGTKLFDASSYFHSEF